MGGFVIKLVGTACIQYCDFWIWVSTQLVIKIVEMLILWYQYNLGGCLSHIRLEHCTKDRGPWTVESSFSCYFNWKKSIYSWCEIKIGKDFFSWYINWTSTKLFAKQPEHELMTLKHPVATSNLIRSNASKEAKLEWNTGCRKNYCEIWARTFMIWVGNLNICKVLVVECRLQICW